MTPILHGMFKGMLLDVDGTLIDNVPAHIDSWKDAFSMAGFFIEDQRIHDQIGKGSDQFVPALLGEVNEQVLRQIGETHHRLYRERWLPKVQAFPDAARFLQELKARHLQIAVATSAPQDELARHLDQLPRHLIDAIISASDVQHTKPAPEMFHKALEALRDHEASLTADQVVVVGDTPYDAQAAQKAGMTSIGLLTGGFSDEQLKKSGAKWVFRNLDELTRHLDQVLGA